MKTFSLILALCLSGCSTFTATKSPDGSLSVTSIRILNDAEIGEVSAHNKTEAITVKGVKTTTNTSALDLIKAAAALSHP